MKEHSSAEYFRPKTYLGYILSKITHGGLWQAINSIYKKIRKFTLISAIFRWLGIAIALLEKSAVLLLLATCLLLVLPMVVILVFIYAIICVSKYITLHKTLQNWLLSGENMSVFITNERIFSNDERLFLRCAETEAASYSNPVIVVCSDRFIAAKWYSLNLLAVRTDYYFILKRYYFPKRSQKTTVIVL